MSVTEREFLKAVRKNGYKQLTGDLFIINTDHTILACAAGQALLNLGVVTEDEIYNDPTIIQYSSGRAYPHTAANKAMTWLKENNLLEVYTKVYHLNDSYGFKMLSCEEIADRLLREYSDDE